jgi:hypothetical protein
MCGDLSAGRWWLVAGGWLLVAGCWWLVAGGWWRVAGGGWRVAGETIAPMSGQPCGFCFAFALFLMGSAGVLAQDAAGLLREVRELDWNGQYGEARERFRKDAGRWQFRMRSKAMVGYVAFYEGDFKAALAEFHKARRRPQEAGGRRQGRRVCVACGVLPRLPLPAACCLPPIPIDIL